MLVGDFGGGGEFEVLEGFWVAVRQGEGGLGFGVSLVRDGEEGGQFGMAHGYGLSGVGGQVVVSCPGENLCEKEFHTSERLCDSAWIMCQYTASFLEFRARYAAVLQL